MQIKKHGLAQSLVETAHCARLTATHADNCETFKDGLAYFALTLTAMRDKLVLSDSKKPEYDEKLITLIAAVEEYKQYAYCVNKYFYQAGDKIKAVCGDDEKAGADFIKEKQAHLSAFCDIVKKNLLLWEANDAEFQ